MERAVSQADTIRQLTSIEKDLRESGYDTSKLKESIQEHADSIGCTLEQILKDNTKLNVNGEMYLLGVEQKLLPHDDRAELRRLPARRLNEESATNIDEEMDES